MTNSSMKNIIFLISFFALLITTFYLFVQIEHYDRSLNPKLDEIKILSSSVHPVIENIELYEDDKSYTINKEKVYLCLKDKKTGTYYSNNMLVYVFLHEVAHILCDEIGHTDKFKRIFEDLLYKATKAGIYNPSIPVIDDYCE